MTRWEYTTVQKLRIWLPQLEQKTIINGQDVTDSYGETSLHDIANELGGDGWELVSHNNDKGDTFSVETLWFKRKVKY